MNSFIIIKPAKEGNVVRHPHTSTYLKPEGERVRYNPYWKRRLDDGSVVEVKAEVKETVEKKTKKTSDKDAVEGVQV